MESPLTGGRRAHRFRRFDARAAWQIGEDLCDECAQIAGGSLDVERDVIGLVEHLPGNRWKPQRDTLDSVAKADPLDPAVESDDSALRHAGWVSGPAGRSWLPVYVDADHLHQPVCTRSLSVSRSRGRRGRESISFRAAAKSATISSREEAQT